jgi:hypothetical protein
MKDAVVEDEPDDGYQVVKVGSPTYYAYPFAEIFKMVDARSIMKKAMKTGAFGDLNFGNGSASFLEKIMRSIGIQLEGLDLDDDFAKGFLRTMEPILKEIPEMFLDAYKGMGNATYGCFAEKPHGKELPAYNNLLFASFITAWCRAQLLRHLDPASIIMCATDSLITTEPILGENPKKGDAFKDGNASWELKDHYDYGFFLLAGVYQLGDLPLEKPLDDWTNEEKERFKTRGVPPEDLRKAWPKFKTGETTKITVYPPELFGWKVFYKRSQKWLSDYKAKYGQDFKADEWVPGKKTLSVGSNAKRNFRISTRDVPSIPSAPRALESQPDRKYRMIEELGMSESQLDAMVKK